MDKKDVIEFFDSLAPGWDSGNERNEKVIEFILQKGGIKKGSHILDVGCGTGVLFGDYEKIGAASVTGIDISPEMVKIAKEKFPAYKVVCADAESYSFDESFDAVMIYNAFPHFAFPEKLIENLSSYLKEGGRFTVAHGISEAALAECHSGIARHVSLPLPSKEAMKEMMSDYLNVDVTISDEEKYIVSGTKK